MAKRNDDKDFQMAIQSRKWEYAAHIVGLHTDDTDGLEDYLTEGDWSDVPTLKAFLTEWRRDAKGGVRDFGEFRLA